MDQQMRRAGFWCGPGETMLLEICADSVESAIAAERGGAQRVELCSDLLEGGITPSHGLTAQVRRRIGIELFVMIRPRGGDFCYDDDELALMEEDIRHARTLGADGVVLGVLDERAEVDVARTRRLVELAAPLPVTFHRAIDMTPDPRAAMEAVIRTGARRVLTSGGAAKATEGSATIARMVETAGERIGVIAGGGLNAGTVVPVAGATGANEFHASLRRAVPSLVQYQRDAVHMGEADREYLRWVTREDDVRELVRALERVQEERGARLR
jgi:copper homeostasis protein